MNRRKIKINMNGRQALMACAVVIFAPACEGIANSSSLIGNFFARTTIVPIVKIAPATTANSGPTNIDRANSGRKNASPEPKHIIVIPRRAFKLPPVTITISHGQSKVKTPNCNDVKVASCTESIAVTLPKVTSGIPIEP